MYAYSENSLGISALFCRRKTGKELQLLLGYSGSQRLNICILIQQKKTVKAVKKHKYNWYFH